MHHSLLIAEIFEPLDGVRWSVFFPVDHDPFFF
jgi:hypothetical protein